MYKRIYTLLVALVTCFTMSAQTDMTDRISDPDFEQEGPSLWKTNSFGRQGNNDFPLKHGGYYREVWSGGTAMDAYIYQDLTDMPVGTYTLTVTCQNVKQSNKNQVCKGTWIYANNQKTDFNVPADYSVSCVVTDGNLRIGAEIKNCTGNYVCIDNVRLTYQLIFADVKEFLEQLVAEANAQIEAGRTVLGGSPAEAQLEAAIEALQTLMNAAQDEGMDAAVKGLQDAMTAYRLHLASPDSPMDATSFITNPSFESGNTGWTFEGMGTQGNSDFRKVGNTYSETWAEWGHKVHDAKLWQTLTALPNGRYKLTAVAQNIQQQSPNTKQKGCYVFGGGEKTEVDVYGTYAVEFICVSGEATIGFETAGATGNYCCVDDFHLYFLGFDEEAEQTAFNALIAQAEGLTELDMNTTVKETLKTAIADAKDVTGATGRDTASRALTDAIAAARASNALYLQLDAVIAKGEAALATGKPNGQERLQTAITSAKGLKASGDIDADKVKTAENMIDDGIFVYNVMNGSGTAPKVTTGEIIVGSSGMVGRMKTTGSNIIERGFCWAEQPTPTVMDHHTSYNQSNDETNNSPVWVMYDVQPSTEYWVRAYAITKTYAVGYGDPVRVITLPKGETEYTFLWNGDDEHNAWLDQAMREATTYYNTWTAIKGFHPTANYSPGTETADCSYGGWINVGPWRCNTGTMVHEMMHGTGVGQHGRYWSQELHPDIWWLGERANRVCHFFENYDTNRGNYNCNGDGMHICYEGNGNDMQQIRSCILMQALYEDGLPAVSDGACPFYSFESIDTLHYYITNCAYGTNTKYLCESTTGALTYKAADASEVLEDEAFAWNVIYDKMTGLYFIRNLKSGKYFRHTGSTVNLVETQPNTTQAIQLMPARITMDFTVGDTTITKKPYWFARGDRSENPSVMAIDGVNKTTVSTPTLNFANTATKQFWLIYTSKEIQQLHQAQQDYDINRLRQLVEGSMALIESGHHQLEDNADAGFSEKVAAAQALLPEPEATSSVDLQPAIVALLTDVADYLSKIEATTADEPLDISFILENPDLKSKTGWTGVSEVKNGIVEFNSKFSISQKTISLPAGNYELRASAFQRPGKLATVNNDFEAGKNNVSSKMMANNDYKFVKHIAESERTEKLNQGGTEQQVNGIYQPTNVIAAAAYFTNGHYENQMPFTLDKTATVTVKLMNAKNITNDWTVCGGFRLLYYGASINPDGIEQMKNEEFIMKNGTDALYDLSGRLIVNGNLSIGKLQKGIYILNGRKILVK